MLKSFNANQVIRMFLVESHITTDWQYQAEVPAKKLLGFLPWRDAAPAGWYHYYGDSFYYTTAELIAANSNLTLNPKEQEQHSVWEKPYVVIEFVNKSRETVYI